MMLTQEPTAPLSHTVPHVPGFCKEQEGLGTILKTQSICSSSSCCFQIDTAYHHPLGMPVLLARFQVPYSIQHLHQTAVENQPPVPNRVPKGNSIRKCCLGYGHHPQSG